MSRLDWLQPTPADKMTINHKGPGTVAMVSPQPFFGSNKLIAVPVVKVVAGQGWKPNFVSIFFTARTLKNQNY
jgi:hypothetical protein